MTNRELTYACILLTGVFLSSVSQIILKKSAQKEYESRLKEYLNPMVMTAYFIFFSCTFLSMFALKVIPLSLGNILETCGYVFVTILSAVILKEKISRQKLLGMLIIITGIFIFTF